MPIFSTNYIGYYIIVAVPVYLLVRWIVLKYRKESIQTALFSILAAILLTPILCWAFVTVTLYTLYYKPTPQFNQEVWLKKGIDRHRLIDDLIATKTLMNKDSMDVKALLGTDIYRPDPKTWVYHAGHSTDIFFTIHSLRIRYTNEGKVDSVWHDAYAD